MIFTKDMIGQAIYAIPTGNNARGANKDKVVTFQLESIGKIYIGLRLIDSDWKSNYIEKYDPKTGATQSDVKSGHSGNAGYIFFASIDSVAEYYLSVELGKDLMSAIQGSMGYGVRKDLSISQMERILEILGESNV